MRSVVRWAVAVTVTACSAASSWLACSRGPSAATGGNPDATSGDGAGGGAGEGGRDGGAACVLGTGAQATQTIGTDGGTVSLEGVTLAIPPGALHWDQPITITSSTTCGPNFAAQRTPLYQFGPEGLQLAQPAQITLALPGGTQPAMLFWTTPFGDFAGAALSPDGGAISGAITHFSDGYASDLPPKPGNAPGPVSVTVSPKSVDPGETATVNVFIAPGYDASQVSCTVDDGTGITRNVRMSNASIGTAGSVMQVGYANTTNVQQATTVTVTCTGPNGVIGTATEIPTGGSAGPCRMKRAGLWGGR